MATGETVADGGGYLDRVFSYGGDALTAYIDGYRKQNDVSAQERIIRASAEQDRISNATSLAYAQNARQVDVKNATIGGVPMWVMIGGGLLVGSLGLFAVFKLAQKK